MKKLLLFCLVVVMLAGQAMASMYEMDVATAIQLRDVSWSDASLFGANILKWVGYNPGTTADAVYGIGSYGALNPMHYQVGFVADLTDNGGDGFASVKIGAAWTDPAYGTNTVLSYIQGLSGSFDSFSMPISNDNDDFWEYMLYVETATSGNYYTTWNSLASGSQLTLSVGTGSGVLFSDVTDIGLGIRLNVALQGQTSDDFHTSVVPVPGALLLGILGLGSAGLKLRKFA